MQRQSLQPVPMTDVDEKNVSPPLRLDEKTRDPEPTVAPLRINASTPRRIMNRDGECVLRADCATDIFRRYFQSLSQDVLFVSFETCYREYFFDAKEVPANGGFGLIMEWYRREESAATYKRTAMCFGIH